VEAVAHLGVAAEDAEDVVVALDGGLDALELDAAVLRDGRDTGREASGERREHGLDGGRGVVLGGEGLRVVALEHEGLLVLVLLAETREALDGLAGVRAADPLRGRLP